MKTNIFLSVAILLLFLNGNISSQQIASKNTIVQPGTVTIISTPDLNALTSNWASEYNRLYPETKIKLVNADYNATDLSAGKNLSFISNKSQSTIENDKNWKMVVGRDVIVPIMNAGNPFLNEIEKRGISQEQFAQVFNNPDKQNWGTLLANGQNAAIHIYIINDESVKAGVAKFMQATQIPTAGITIGTKDEVISAIQHDPFALGFLRVVNVMSLDNQGLLENIKLMPIDKNGNGTIDHMEDIFGDVNALLRGVWIGKYPKTLYSNIYAVSNAEPTNEAEIAFLSWVITDGQQYMNANGFCDLASTESQSQLAKFNLAAFTIQPEEKSSNAGLILLIAAMLIIIGIIVTASVRRYRKQATAIPDFNDSFTGFNESAVKVPNGLYFDKSHIWAFMEKDGNVSIGIDDFLQHITGPITRVDMKNPGDKIKKGELIFSIVQYGKQLSLYAPISGTIKKQNETLIVDASKMNSSPYNDGWVYMIEPSNWFKEIQFMDMADKYKKWIDTEFSRIKDFLAATLKPESLEYSHLVLQDGGVLKEGILADFGPEVWDDFQTNFLDNYK